MCRFGLAVLLLCIYCNVARCQLTATEDLIRTEILRLGGDWEGETEPRLVQFIGKRFGSSQFEMLTHLRSVKTLSIYECDLTVEALRCVAQIEGLEQLQINSSQVDGECFSQLKNNRRLTTLLIENTRISNAFAKEIAKLSSLRTLTFDYCLVESEFDDEIAKMTSLENGYAMIFQEDGSEANVGLNPESIAFIFLSQEQITEYLEKRGAKSVDD